MKSLIVAGITVWTIPFLSAVSVGFIILALVWVKEKITLILFPTSLNEIS
ncbi:MAG: hypothetical protein HC847_07220 [Hydrococcus sp. RU_2_2]|nr:hypothetical protein [Hydrococcus sp. RU_2_2]NJP18831.1 hypothetical protein [Hydrococcus sp. CRU_1_1]